MPTPSALSRLGAVVRRLRRLRGTLGPVALALALVAGQGGALLHELSHYQGVVVANEASRPGAANEASRRGAANEDSLPAAANDAAQPVAATDDPHPASPDHGGKVCDLCLAFAQLAGVLHSDPFAAPLVVDLRHRAATVDAPAVVAVATPAPRSRGPPSLL